MVKGIDAAASGMIGMMSMNDIISNNLANINTPGFKQSIATFQSFKDVMVSKIDASNGYTQSTGESLGTLSTGSAINQTALDFKQGSLQVTGNPTDLALQGQGFFEIQTPNGIAYTRNGSFIRNDKAELTTTDGYHVIGRNGPITLNNNNDFSNVKITEDGTVEINNKIIDKINIVDFKNKANLQSIGTSLYAPINGEKPVAATNCTVKDGALESSNSNVIECMVNSINASRTYESLSKVIDSNNKSLNHAVNEVGRIR